MNEFLKPMRKRSGSLGITFMERGLDTSFVRLSLVKIGGSSKLVDNHIEVFQNLVYIVKEIRLELIKHLLSFLYRSSRSGLLVYHPIQKHNATTKMSSMRKPTFRVNIFASIKGAKVSIGGRNQPAKSNATAPIVSIILASTKRQNLTRHSQEI
jgi:hypothetical protein